MIHKCIQRAGACTQEAGVEVQPHEAACPEEIAWHSGWIDNAQLEKMAQLLIKSGYGQYLLGLLKEKVFV